LALHPTLDMVDLLQLRVAASVGKKVRGIEFASLFRKSALLTM